MKKELVTIFTCFVTIVTAAQTVIDIDGNIYKTVIIGKQEWMAENLRVTHYADGTSIPKVTNDTSWQLLKNDYNDDAYCWYNYDSLTYYQYGAYYSWAAAIKKDSINAIDTNEIKGVCPMGWHIPSKAEWEELLTYVDSNTTEESIAFALKSKSKWNNDKNGSDEFGFNAFPYSWNNPYYGFENVGNAGLWWSSQPYGTWSDNDIYEDIFAYRLKISKGDTADIGGNYYADYLNASRSAGLCVRCVKNDVTSGNNHYRNNFNIFPNPANDKIYFSFSGYFNGTLNIYDLQGKRVLSKRINSNSIDISTLNKGVYFLQVSNTNQKIMSKLIIE